jgi:hypothetical protein
LCADHAGEKRSGVESRCGCTSAINPDPFPPVELEPIEGEITSDSVDVEKFAARPAVRARATVPSGSTLTVDALERALSGTHERALLPDREHAYTAERVTPLTPAEQQRLAAQLEQRESFEQEIGREMDHLLQAAKVTPRQCLAWLLVRLDVGPAKTGRILGISHTAAARLAESGERALRRYAADGATGLDLAEQIIAKADGWRRTHGPWGDASIDRMHRRTGVLRYGNRGQSVELSLLKAILGDGLDELGYIDHARRQAKRGRRSKPGGAAPDDDDLGKRGRSDQ